MKVSPLIQWDGGDVLDVSPGGSVLASRTGADDTVDVCLAGNDGVEQSCWAIDDPPGFNSAISWSPDGRSFAFDGTADSPPLAVGSSVRIVDTASHEVSDLFPSDSSDEFFDFHAAWVDDDDMALLRGPRDGDERDANLNVVFTDTRGTVQSFVPLRAGLADLVPQTGAIVAGRYIAAVRGSDGVMLVAAGPYGVEEAIATGWPFALVGGTSASGELAVVVMYDPGSGEVGATATIDASLQLAMSDVVRAVAATYAPDGEIVAAIEIDDSSNAADGGARPTSQLVLWDPHTDAARPPIELDVAALGVRWTTDDQVIVWGVDEWQVIDIVRS